MRDSDRIYLDYAATTPLCLEAREAMQYWLRDGCGNPSSLHHEGRMAKHAIDAARETLSAELGCRFAEALFTSGGTEAANLAIVGAALQNLGGNRNRILLGAAEHHCVLNTRPTLEALGYRVEAIPVDRQARIDIDAMAAMLDENVLLASCMHANNELGTLNPIREIADLAHHHGALLHSDAVQTFYAPGLSWKVGDLDADLLTVSSHKLYGPKGAGAIYIRAGVSVKPILAGGGQEREMRGGTENVAAIAGFGTALKAPRAEAAEIADLRDGFEKRMASLGAIPTVPNRNDRLAGHCHVRFPGIDAETVLILLDRLGLSASSGAACSSGSIEPSHVLLACGYSMAEAKEGLRLTFGRGVNLDMADKAADTVSIAISQIRNSRK